MARVSYETVNPSVIGQEDKRPAGPLRRMAEVLAGAMQGSLNIGGTVRLNGTETILVDSRIGSQSVILFMALDGMGASVMQNGIWVTLRGKGSATLNHLLAAGVDLEYIVIG